MPPSFITLKSHAKINLYLDVISKRDDGYHNISTIFTPIDLHDTITLSKEPENITLSCDNASVPPGGTNLAHIAARRFFKESGIRPGVSIAIKKNIPVAAGLGGGSSNAAATLIGLSALFDGPLEENRLFEIAATIGADVPFFIESRPVYAEGIGDKFIAYPELPGLFFLLVNPRFSVSARFAYENITSAISEKKGLTRESLDSLNSPELVAGILKNSLEEPVTKRYPIINDIKRELLKNGSVGALMSGSGPTVFGIYDDKEKINAAAKIMASKMPDLDIIISSNKL